MELKKIKSIRKSEIDALAASPIKRKLKKIGYLLRYGMPFNKFIKYTLFYALILPLVKIKMALGSKAVRKKYFGNGGKDRTCAGGDTCYIAVNIGNSGIGDAIVAVRFLRYMANFVNESNKTKTGINGNTGNGKDETFKKADDMKVESSGNKIAFDIFYRSPGSIEFITAVQPNIRRVLNLADYELLRKFYDIDLKLNTFFMKEEINEASRKKLSEKFPAVLKIIGNIKTNQTHLEKYIKTRPFSEGILSDAVTAMGLSRASYLNYTAGIGINGNFANNGLNIGNAGNDTRKFDKPGQTEEARLNIDTDSTATTKFNLKGVKFITIHDGWDENAKITGKISTKSYPPQKWPELVKLFKREIPGYLTVQLGGLGNGSDIAGVDLNLRGKTSLKEAASILSESSLHIDADSGLVHIAASLGTPCAVLFGPTNAAYCSYSETPNNITITPRLCGNCWWSADGWMNSCPRRLAVPECMDSIEPADVINAIKEIKLKQIS